MERTSRMRSGGGPSRVARTMGRNTTAVGENTGRLMRAVGDASAEMISGSVRVFSNFFADAMDSMGSRGRYYEDRGYRSGGYRREERDESTRRDEGGEDERSGRYEREDEGGRVEVEAYEGRSVGDRPRRGYARDLQDDFQHDFRDRAGNVGGTVATAIRDSARVLSRSMERFSDALDTQYIEDEDEEFEAGDRYVHEERTVRRGGEGAREETTRTVRVEAAAPRTEEKRKVETTKVERTEEKKS